MAWRVSWAAACRVSLCARPTPNIKTEPKNKHATPAKSRCDSETLVEIVDVVMSPSVRPVESSLLSGRSPDLRYFKWSNFRFASKHLLARWTTGFSAFPVAQWHMLKPNRSQLRGQSRFWPRLGGPHRVPYYACGRLASKHRTRPSWQGRRLCVNTKATQSF